MVDDINDASPNDISYVYSGYAPLSIRLVQCITQKNAISSAAPVVPDAEERRGKAALPQAHPISGWRGFEDVMSAIPGMTIDIRQKAEGVQGEMRETRDNVTTVVFFLGGCTFTEIAALRWMSKKTRGRRFLIATTGIINGTTVSFLPSIGVSSTFGADEPQVTGELW